MSALMSVISMVDHDLAVVYSKLMPVSFRDLLTERGIELVEVDDAEYANLGSNVLALAPRVCVMPAGNPKTRKAPKKPEQRYMSTKATIFRSRERADPHALLCR